MKIISRTTREFIVLKVDEIECTIFKSDKDELKEMIENLEDIIDDLKSYL